MLLLTYRADPAATATSWGVQSGDGGVIDLPALAARSASSLPATLLDFIRDGGSPGELQKLLDAAAPADLLAASREPGAVRLCAPLRPGKIVGVGLNYVEHVAESARSLDTASDAPQRPVLFSKPATAVVGPDEPIEHNANLTTQLDWEVELAVIIGRTARRVPVTAALDHVFGYTITNDISARDQRRSGQWFYSKGQDSYAPLGPVVLTADELPDPQTLGLSLSVNGEQKQSGNTKQMLFSIAELIADISAGMTLEPGDVIATGSPQGVGAAQNPPQFLQPGDVVEATIERIGTLRNPVVDAR
jgi:2-keto-4-pentenoate hydratase/2-oxohepta-3-ene-1,7-dioic acid hydratase in catechol pathway